MARQDIITKPRNSYRRIVPQGYATATLTLIGTSPLLMNSAEADRDGELFRAYTMLGKKRPKSLDDEARLREMEWQLRIYLDDELGPYIPGKNVKEMLRSAATKWKKGEEIKRSLIIAENRIPLLYDGPRDQAGLWAAGYRYTTMVANNGAGAGRVVRCRPKFEDWSLKAEVAYDPEDLDLDFLHLVVDRSRKYGLGDFRPTFGSFDAKLEAVESIKDGARGDASKKLNQTDVGAHRAFVDRIKEAA